MTDKTKTPRELALEALGDLTVAAYGLEEMVEASKIFNWSEIIRKALSQEQPEPIEDLGNAIHRLKRSDEVRPMHDYAPYLYIKDIEKITDAATKFHNLTKEKK